MKNGHLKELLNAKQEEPHITAALPVKEPSIEKTLKVISKLKKSKALGSNKITAEFPKNGDDVLHR